MHSCLRKNPPGRYSRSASRHACSSATTRPAQRELAERDAKLRQHRAVLEAGADPVLVTSWINETQARRAAAQTRLRKPAGRRRMTREEIAGLVTALGDLMQVLRDADPADKAEVYRRLAPTCGTISVLGKLDVSPLPEILRAQRRHLAQLHHLPWQQVGHRRQRRHPRHRPGAARRHLDPGPAAAPAPARPGTWDQALACALAVSRSRQDHGPGHPVVEIAIYPDVVWLAARSLQAHSASHRAA